MQHIIYKSQVSSLSLDKFILKAWLYLIEKGHLHSPSTWPQLLRYNIRPYFEDYVNKSNLSVETKDKLLSNFMAPKPDSAVFLNLFCIIDPSDIAPCISEILINSSMIF